MENSSARFELMSLISKAVIILPLAIIIIALLIKFDARPKTLEQKITAPTIILTQIPISSARATDEAKLNLLGPLVCSYQDKTSSISASIKNNQILIVSQTNKTTQKYLVQDDCFYSWETLKLTGEKKCGGIKQILNVINMLLGLNILPASNIDSYFSQIETAGQSLQINQAQMKTLLNSCKKESISDSIFILPKEVRFTTASK